MRGRNRGRGKGREGHRVKKNINNGGLSTPTKSGAGDSRGGGRVKEHRKDKGKGGTEVGIYFAVKTQSGGGGIAKKAWPGGQQKQSIVEKPATKRDNHCVEKMNRPRRESGVGFRGGGKES